MAEKIDWHGLNDGTPCSSIKGSLTDDPGYSPPKGDAWKGMSDGTPASKPTDPDKG